jgi:IS30 family transposase
MTGYTQLTEGERNQIYVLNKRGLKQSEIAHDLGREPSTISRELKRNRGGRGYRPKQAHREATERRRAASSRPKMKDNVVAHVEAKLGLQWSPEQISGTMEDEIGIRISHERIYQHIYKDRLAGGNLHTHLRHGRKKRRKRCNPGERTGNRGKIKNRRDIDERSALVDTRLTQGHWEIDTIIGKGQEGAAVTIVERKSRFTLIAGVENRTAEQVTAATIRLLQPYGDQVVSITADNGKEFAHHEEIAEALKVDFYFARPYHSWERGTNENTNGLIRQYLPKSESLSKLSDETERFVMERLNNRPRKILGFRTPSDELNLHLN